MAPKFSPKVVWVSNNNSEPDNTDAGAINSVAPKGLPVIVTVGSAAALTVGVDACAQAPKVPSTALAHKEIRPTRAHKTCMFHLQKSKHNAPAASWRIDIKRFQRQAGRVLQTARG
jgi:hypothetical protein